MGFSVKTISVFERQAKRLIKKFPSLRKEIQNLVKELMDNPERGTSIGRDCYKIRIAIASKGKGKSGGARVITHLVLKDGIVYLLSIYDKSDIESLTDKEILELIKLIP
jgi:mRNA-degrading endonuclease RelE of RelBE toxin-antitoxin system